MFSGGVRVARNDSKKFYDTVRRNTELQLVRLGAEAAARARKTVPVKSGALKASIFSSLPGAEPPADSQDSTILPRKATVGYFRALNSGRAVNIKRAKNVPQAEIAAIGRQSETYTSNTETRVSVSIGASKYYAGNVELGSPAAGRPPHPFIGPAVEWAASQLPSRMKTAFGGAA